MTKNDFNELRDKTESLRKFYRDHTDKKIIITETEWLKKYPYKTTPIRICTPLSLGITDLFFGGQVYRAAKVQSEPVYILANRDDMTIGILIRKEDIPELSYITLQKLATKYRLKCGPKAKKEDIVKELLT